MKRKKHTSKSLSGWLNSAKDFEANAPSIPSQRSHSRKGSLVRRTSSSNSSGIRRIPSQSKLRKDSGKPLPKDAVPWFIKHSPTCTSELAVHKKKVQEVQQWFEFALSKMAKHPILLLTGPSGCGKSATVHALSNILSYDIIEWNESIEHNSRSFTQDTPGVYGWDSTDRDLYESQTKRFINFIIRANRYPTLNLVMGGSSKNMVKNKRSKIVLIENFPNVFVHDPKKLHSVLKEVHKRLIYPLVLIVSESQHAVGTTSRLLPSSVISDLDIHCIHFNPIARTSTLKTLQRILELEQQDNMAVYSDKSVLERIEECCNGDIRAAINVLQFTCSQSQESCDVFEEEYSQSRQCLVGVVGREQPLFLFRALGKVLYSKRGSDINEDMLPPHLVHHNRAHLLTNPEEVYESVQLSSDMFTTYLHHNYLDFYEDIEDVDPAIGYLSDSDVIGHIWNDVQDRHRSTGDSCRCSVASRGLIFTNKRLSSSRWRPLYKPKWTSVMQQHVNNTRLARETFLHLTSSSHAHLWMPCDLVTDILPYMAFSNIPLRNQSQISLLHTLTTFRGTPRSLHTEQLGETEQDENPNIAGASIDIHSHTSSIGMSLSQQISQDMEEYEEIEDFDS